MNQTADQGGDISRQGRFNGVVIAVVVIVGLVGAWLMFGTLDRSAPPQAARVPPAAGDAARPATPANDTAPSAAATPAGQGLAARHAIQLSPFGDAATAEEVRAKLEKLGIPSSLRVEAHLQVGPFRSQEEAEAARAKLKELGVYGGQLITLKL